TGIVPGCYVLYLGCASGTTVSHVSDIVGKKGLIFAVDLSSRVLRELVFISEERGNIAPILADASKIGELAKTVVLCDVLFQDIAQKTQLAIFLKNLVFLKKDGYAILCVKSRSIDVTKEPKKIFAEIKRELSKHITIIDEKNLYPYEKDHYIFLCRKR
ncbi:fibrillin, partial [Candidatus Woesearchaeota archaeon CG11_big_fil_rev_8_21_14_0_20_43_8]